MLLLFIMLTKTPSFSPGLTYGQINGGASRHWFGGGGGFWGGGWYKVV